MLAGIWGKFIKVENIGIHDNFFDLGGHSLLALRLFAEIEKKFKYVFLYQASSNGQRSNTSLA